MTTQAEAARRGQWWETGSRPAARRTGLVALAVLGLAGALLLGLPLILLTLPDPQPVLISSIAGERNGGFVVTDGRIYKTFAYTAPAQSFPAKVAAVAGRDAVFLVKGRQLDELDSYRLFAYPAETEIAVAKDVAGGNVVRLKPRASLEPGRYVVEAARDSMYGGTDYFYFSVAP